MTKQKDGAKSYKVMRPKDKGQNEGRIAAQLNLILYQDLSVSLSGGGCKKGSFPTR